MMIAVLAALALLAGQAESGGAAEAAAVSVSSSITADGAHVLVHEIVVDAAPPEVWEAVSTAQGWTTWAVPVAWLEGDLLETSYTPTAKPGDPSTIRQHILAREPGRLFAFRTIKAPEGFPHFDAYRQVTSTIELEPLAGGRTKVRLTGAGYPDSEAGRELLGFFREGNRTSLEQLRQRFASGPIDWSRR